MLVARGLCIYISFQSDCVLNVFYLLNSGKIAAHELQFRNKKFSYDVCIKIKYYIRAYTEAKKFSQLKN